MTKRRYKSERVSAWITPALQAHLEQVINAQRRHNRTYNMSDLIRDALRQYLDQQEDILGSRAHQTRTVGKHVKALQARLDELEQHLAVSLQVLQQMLAIVSATQLKHLQRDNVSAQQIIEIGLKAAETESAQQTLQYIQQLAERLQQTDG